MQFMHSNILFFSQNANSNDYSSLEIYIMYCITFNIFPMFNADDMTQTGNGFLIREAKWGIVALIISKH